ncbi:hypothetical protein AK830_g12575 [Neonectria ditissima]|uniref:Zn(2)-C6 fungal-type domain-containing protein n=1 Tax=Neonectria ditissima TaxID=78410 RepID=A0A0P7B082_9HYPO|nr:hypothetical protein AK830_g12575 [Neonectria ditissima]
MSPATASTPAKRRRRRPARSCEQCRRRKIRCDQDQPCAGCVRARAPMQCTYRDGSPGRAPSKAREEAMLEDDSASGTASEASHLGGRATGQGLVVGYPRDRAAALEKKRDALAVAVSEREALPSTQAQRTSPLVISSSSSSSSIPPLMPRLRNVPEKTKLFGQTHWLHTAEKFPVSGKFHPVEVEPSFNDAKAELLEALNEARNLRYTMKALNRVKLKEPICDIPETLPLRETCDELIRCYFRTLEPLYRIVHIPSFWREYHRIWELQPTAPPTAVFLVKLTLILAIGTTFYNPSSDAEAKQCHHLAQSWIQNAQWWLTGPSEKTTYNIEGLQVFCLLLIARQTTFNCSGGTSWLSAGSLLRIAITMGLHRNPKLFPTLSPCHREFRARLWATVLELSVQSCLDLALPLDFSADDYDAFLPSNYNDCDLDSDTQNAPAPMSVFTDTSLQILLAKSLPLRINILRLLNDFRNEKSYETALALGTDIRVACREVAAFFHAYKYVEGDSRGGGPGLRPTEFHRKFMDLHIRRFTMFLHRDFMLRARTDPRFYLSRKTCVEAAMVVASSSKGADLSLPLKDWDDMSRLSLVGRGLFKCALSFDATLVLALEVVTQLDDESAPQAEADALDEMAKATRAPLIQVLEGIRDQLTHLISRGNTSLKRLLFVEAHLTQIRAMESGHPIKNAVYDTVNKMLRRCVSILRESCDAATPPESGSALDLMPIDLAPLDMFQGDTEMNWDISNLLCFSTLNEVGQIQWPTAKLILLV